MHEVSSIAEPRTTAHPFDFTLEPVGPVSQAFLAEGIPSFADACARIARATYRRVSNPVNPLAVLQEGCGTCSSKHILLKRLADEQGKGERVKLMLGIFFWGPAFSPRLEPVLAGSGFPVLPEAHCYLRIDGCIVDLTSDAWGPPRFVETLAEEIEIDSMDSAMAMKRDRHRSWMANWLAREHPEADFEMVWGLREACVHALSSHNC